MHKVTGVQGKHQGSRFAKGRRFQDSRAPMVTGLQESTVAGFHKAPRFPSSVAVTGFQGCNVTGQKLQACTRIPRMLVSKLFRVPRFQDSRVYRSRLFMVPLFQNLMTHETARRGKGRKMQNATASQLQQGTAVFHCLPKLQTIPARDPKQSGVVWG